MVDIPDKSFLEIGSDEGFSLEQVLDKSAYDNDGYIRLFVEIATSAFQRPRGYKDVRDHTIGSEQLYLMRFRDQIVGFGTTRNIAAPQGIILYLDGVAIASSFQNQGLFKRLLHEVQGSEDFVMGRTQNPLVIGACKKHVNGSFYPNNCNPPERVKGVAEFVAKDLLKMGHFDRDMLVGQSAYNECLYTKVPDCAEKEYLERILNFGRGDAVIFVIDRRCENE